MAVGAQRLFLCDCQFVVVLEYQQILSRHYTVIFNYHWSGSMTEIVVSLGLMVILSVSNLKIMTAYLQAEKATYYRTLEIVQAMSAAEWQL